jgi:hypothetical protein
MNDRWGAALRRYGLWVGLLVLQACGGGSDATAPTERAAEVTAAAAVDGVDFTTPDGRLRFRLDQLDDGTLRLAAAVAPGLTGDLRAIYFNLAGDNVAGLSVDGDQVTARKIAANAVTQAGAADTRLARQSGVATSGPFDVGVEIGTRSTMGSDNITSTVITIARTGGLVLADLDLAWVGAVAANVGDPAVRRRDDINLAFQPSIVLPPAPPPARVFEVGAAHLCWFDGLYNRCAGDTSAGQAPGSNTLVLATTQLAAGVRHTCGLGQRLANGSFIPDIGCWGAGQTDFSQPLPRPVFDGQPIQVAAGNDTTCVVVSLATSDRRVQCWRATLDAGQLSPYTLDLGVVTDLAVGAARACAISSAGTLQCWNKDTGVDEGAPAGLALTQIDAWGGVACGATTTGTVACWTIALATVEPNTPTLTGVTQVAVGENFACALANGSVSCWGTSSFVAPDLRVLSVPTTLGSVRSIEAGGSTVCANKTATGEVVCWGAISTTLFPVP